VKLGTIGERPFLAVFLLIGPYALSDRFSYGFSIFNLKNNVLDERTTRLRRPLQRRSSSVAVASTASHPASVTFSSRPSEGWDKFVNNPVSTWLSS
jgi:hypothetical protein